ncbi:Uncharacterised protein [Mycobacteroides abscessus]|nr:Uncharacterised protein [Mycobacteroides abscessus]
MAPRHVRPPAERRRERVQVARLHLGDEHGVAPPRRDDTAEQMPAASPDPHGAHRHLRRPGWLDQVAALSTAPHLLDVAAVEDVRVHPDLGEALDHEAEQPLAVGGDVRLRDDDSSASRRRHDPPPLAASAAG